MTARPPFPLLLLTVLGFGSLYTPQPLLPELAVTFGVDAATVSLLISVAMLPLAFAPLVYGYLLEGVPVQRMILWSAFGLAACQSGLALADAWWQLVLLRTLEGLCLPALFTALMTAISTHAPPDRVRQALAWYIATSIVGGFGGRALSGLIAEQFGWRSAFAVWALGLVIAILIATWRPTPATGHFSRPHPRVFAEVLRRKPLRFAYVSIFLVFFVFAGFLNVLPFRLLDVAPDLGSGAVGLAYGGYLVGVGMALGGEALKRRIGSEQRLLMLGVGCYLAGVSMFAIPGAAGLYAGMFAFCAGMFLIHGRLSGHVNERAGAYRGIVNGLYISSYYLGGSLGAWLLPLTYRGLGWPVLLAALAAGIAAAGLGLRAMLRAEAPGSG
jgi:YNFM family putative membrane transporter